MEVNKMIEGVKKVFEMAQQSDNYDLMKEMMSIQSQAYELQEENQKLKEEIKLLDDFKDIENSLVFKRDAYYKLYENDIEDGPYCSRCWDKNKQLIRLLNDRCSEHRLECPECKFSIVK